MQIGVNGSGASGISLVILNLALLGWFVIEMAASAYIIYKIVTSQ